MKNIAIGIVVLLIAGCTSANKNQDSIPVVGFLDVTEDATLAEARKGFFDALSIEGFDETKGTLAVYKGNGNGEIPTLLQACDYLISRKPDLLATNATSATVTAVQRTKDIPVCMMVSPRPDIAGLTDKQGNSPVNLFGVYETLEYIDQSVTNIKLFFPAAKLIGTIYNQSEPQSRDAFERLSMTAAKEGMTVVSLPVNNSSETQLVTQSLLQKKPDVFFALPDNVIFGSFETVVKSCNDAKVPVFTSEAGLVKRGALASFGADFYAWGQQAGKQASHYLKTKSMSGLKPEIVNVRKNVYNKNALLFFGLTAPPNFSAVE